MDVADRPEVEQDHRRRHPGPHRAVGRRRGRDRRPGLLEQPLLRGWKRQGRPPHRVEGERAEGARPREVRRRRRHGEDEGRRRAQEERRTRGQQARRAPAHPGELGRGQPGEDERHRRPDARVGGDALRGEQRRIHQEDRLEDEDAHPVARGAARAEEQGAETDEQPLVELQHGHEGEQAAEPAGLQVERLAQQPAAEQHRGRTEGVERVRLHLSVLAGCRSGDGRARVQSTCRTSHRRFTCERWRGSGVSLQAIPSVSAVAATIRVGAAGTVGVRLIDTAPRAGLAFRPTRAPGATAPRSAEGANPC